MLAKYQPLISKVTFSPPPELSLLFTTVFKDKQSHGISDTDSTAYIMFVDDSWYVHIEPVIRHSMAARIDVLYIILGYPYITVRQDALSLDNFVQSIYSYQRDQLGAFINTRSMTVGLAEQKRLLMIDEITHWHKGRRSFPFSKGPPSTVI